MTDAEDVIKRLGNKYELLICSIGTLDNISYKAKWIKNNLCFVKNVILITGSLGTTGLKMDKSSIYMQDSIFVDDHAEKLLSTNAEIKICFGKKYNWNKNWIGKDA